MKIKNKWSNHKMATIEKRVSLNLTKEDIRILDLMKKSTGESVNILVKKALFFYYLSHFKDEK